MQVGIGILIWRLVSTMDSITSEFSEEWLADDESAELLLR